MAFSEMVISYAYSRQTKPHEHLGAYCARCGKNLFPSHGNPIPVIPKDKGGRWNTDNCAIVCDECLGVLGGFNHSDEIPLSKFRHFRA